MSLADAVKALKFVKQDLEKHKSLLADKEREVQELSSQLTSLKKAPTPSVPASNGNTNLLGLEMEPSSNNGTPDPAMASLKEQVATLTSEKKVLKNHAKSLSKELEENRSKVTDLNTIVENLGKENDAMKVQVQVLNTSLHDFTASSQTNDDDMAAKVKEKEEELSNLKDSMDSIRKDSAQQWGTRLKAFKEKAEKEKTELEAKLASTTQAPAPAARAPSGPSPELLEAKKQASPSEERRTAGRRSGRRVETLTAEFIEKDRGLEEANAIIQKKAALFEQAKKQIEGGNAAYKKVVKELTEAKQSLAAKDNQVAALSSSASDNDKFVVQLAAKDSEIASLTSNIAALNDQASTKDASIASFESAIAAKDNEIASKSSEIAVLTSSASDNEKIAAQLAAKNSALAAKDSEIASLTSNVASLNDQASMKDASIASFESTIAEKDSEITALTFDVTSLNDQVNAKDAEIATLSSSASDSDKIAAQLAAKDSEIASLTSNVTSLAASISELNSNHKEELKTMSSLHETNKKDLADAIQRDCDEVKRVALQDCANATNSASEAEKSLKEQNASFGILQGEYEQLKRELAKHSTTSTSHITQLEEAKKMVSVFTGKTQDAEQTIMALRAQLDQASQENTALATRLDKPRAESAIKEVKEKVVGVTQIEGESVEKSKDEGGGVKSLASSLDAAKLDEVAEGQQKMSSLVSGLGDKVDGLEGKFEAVVAKVLQKLDVVTAEAACKKAAESGSATSDKAFSELEGKCAVLGQTVAAKETELASLKDLITKKEASISSLEAQLAQKDVDMEQTASMIKDENARYESELRAKDDNIASLQNGVKGQSSVVDSDANESLEGELRAMKEDLAKERSEKKAIRKAAKGLQATVLKLEGELNGLKEQQAEIARATEKAKKMDVEKAAKKAIKEEKKASIPKGEPGNSEPNTQELSKTDSSKPPSHVKSENCDDSCTSCVGDNKFLPSGIPPSPASNGGWVKEVDNHPLPPFGLDSPVISHLLNSWTNDSQKVQYLKMYLQCLTDYSRPIPPTFPKGLTLLGMSKEVKDGFLTLVVPMLSGREDGITVEIYSRIGEKDDDDDEDDDDENERARVGMGADDEIVYDLKLKVLMGKRGGEGRGMDGESREEGKGQVGAKRKEAHTTAVEEEGKEANLKAAQFNLADRIKIRLEAARKSGAK